MLYNSDNFAEILRLYADADTRDDARIAAENLFNSIIQDKADIDADALQDFENFILTFAVYREDGQNKLTEIGAKVLAKYQGALEEFENALKDADVNRVYAMNADQNQIKFDLITFGIYKEMGLVDESKDPLNMTPMQIAETISNIALSEEQKSQYDLKFINTIIGDKELFFLAPPAILANGYELLKKQSAKNKDDDLLKNKLKIVSNRIDSLIHNFAHNYDVYYADSSNISDIYHGYKKICNVRLDDVKIKSQDSETVKQQKTAIINDAKTALQRLEELVKNYAEFWNIKDLKPSDAKKLDERWEELNKLLKEVEITDDVLKSLSKYKFLDENNKPLPQFLDQDGKEQIEFKDGYTLNPNGRLARIISLAKNDVAMQNVGDIKTDVKTIKPEEKVNERVSWKLAEIATTEATVQDAEHSEPEKIEQQNVTETREISDVGYQAALDAQVNQNAGFVEMVADKIGHDKEFLEKPFKAVEDIDKLASTRTEKVAAQQRGQKIGFFKRIIKNFGMAATVSAGLTFIGKATGIAWAGAAVGTVLGIGNMAYQGWKWRREQKKQNKPCGIKEFFSDKRNYGPALASGLGVAAVISMASGNPGLATGFGISAMAVGGGSSAAMLYQDAMNAGYTRGQALAGALGVVGATVAGGFAGRAAMDGLVAFVNNNTDSNLFKTEQSHTTTHETTERVYNDGVIEHHKEMMLKNNWETPQGLEFKVNSLVNAGLTHDDAVRYLLAWHDATDHNLGNGYFKSIGIDSATMDAFRHSIDANGVHLTSESVDVFNKFNPHISHINQVGYFENAPVSHDLPANAAYDANGRVVSGHDFFATYADHNQQAYANVRTITSDTQTIFTPNELAYPAGIGTMGIYEPRVVPDGYMTRLRNRFGALADKIQGSVKGVFKKLVKETKPEVVTQPAVRTNIPQEKDNVPVTVVDTTSKEGYLDRLQKSFGSWTDKVKGAVKGLFKKFERQEKPEVVTQPSVPVEKKPVPTAVVVTETYEPVATTSKEGYLDRLQKSFGSWVDKVKDSAQGFVKKLAKRKKNTNVEETTAKTDSGKNTVKPAKDNDGKANATVQDSWTDKGPPVFCKKLLAHAHYTIDAIWDVRDYWAKRKAASLPNQIELEKQEHELKKQRIKNENELELIKLEHKTKKEKTMKQEKIDNEKLNTAFVKQKSASKMEDLRGELERTRAKLLNEIQMEQDKVENALKKASMIASAQLKQKQEDLEALRTQVELFRNMGGEKALEDAVTMRKMENKLLALKYEQKTNIVREKGRKAVAFFRGMFDITDEDIENAQKAIIIAKKHKEKLEQENESVYKKAQIKVFEKLISTLQFYTSRLGVSEDDMASLDKVVAKVLTDVITKGRE